MQDPSIWESHINVSLYLDHFVFVVEISFAYVADVCYYCENYRIMRNGLNLG